MRRNRSGAPVSYSARAQDDLRVWAYVVTAGGAASTLPRSMHSGAHHLPYSCAPGHVTSWALWFDVLCDALGSVQRAGRLAGLLEADMSAYLRADGHVTFTADNVRRWAEMIENMDRLDAAE